MTKKRKKEDIVEKQCIYIYSSNILNSNAQSQPTYFKPEARKLKYIKVSKI